MLEKITNLLKTGERDNIELAYQLSLSGKISLWPVERALKDLLFYSSKIHPAISFDNLPLGQLCYLLKEVIAISFDNKYLEALPDCFYFMPNLVILEISGNSLKKVPESICELRKLKSLSIKNSQIERLPEKLDQLENLEGLNISKNPKLLQIPPSVYKLPTLKKLRISEAGAARISDNRNFEVILIE